MNLLDDPPHGSLTTKLWDCMNDLRLKLGVVAHAWTRGWGGPESLRPALTHGEIQVIDKQEANQQMLYHVRCTVDAVALDKPPEGMGVRCSPSFVLPSIPKLKEKLESGF